MKKFNYILRSLFAIILLAVGVNTALAEVAVYEITSTTAVTVSGVSPDGSSATFENTYTTKEQLTKDNSMTLTLSGFDGCTITGITMSMKSNKNNGSGNFTATVGSTTIASIDASAFNDEAWNGAYSTSYVDIKPKVTATTVGAGEKVVLKIAATVNSLYCQSFTITYDAPVTSEPTLKANPTELTFSTTPGSTTEAQTITLTAANLTSDVTYSFKNSAFDVVDNGNDTYDVTFTAPAIEGTTNATLTFSAAGVADVVVDLIGESTNTITDVLNIAFTGVTSGSTSYSTWSGKTGTSGAVYAGNSAGSNDAIQLRTTNSNSGIVTTTSGGTAKSVTIEWQSNTGSTRVLQVYGKNTAYTAATDLYDDNKKGTLIGEIDRNSTSLTIADDYEYIGLRSNSGAMYLSEVQIQWTPAAPADPSEVDAPTFSPAAGAVARGTEVTISTNSGSTLSYTVNGGEAVITNTNSATVTINEATTIVAKAIAADATTESDEVTAEYTLVTYALVTNASQLNYGDKVVIAAAVAVDDVYYALSNVQNTNNRDDVAIEKNANNTITINEGVQILTLDAGAKVGTYSFYAEGIVDNDGVPVDDGYLYAASSTSNYLRTTADFSKNGDNASWDIIITDGGVASIVAQGTYSHNVMQYNSSYNLFACYASASQDALSLYRYIPYAENIVCEHNYFLIPNAEWTAAAGNYYAKFINKNTGACAWVKGGNAGEGDAIVFYLSQYNVRSGEMPTYTHVVFFKSETAEEEELSDDVLAAATLKTDELAMTETNNIYTVGGGISTGIESVELADGIRYAYGVVEAEGAIEVYNVNGAVVARGNDNLDLRGLNRGIYIVRNGDQVRKVVR